MNWCRHYREQGIAGLTDHRLGGNRVKLSPNELEELRERLQAYRPRDVLGLQTQTHQGEHWTIEARDIGYLIAPSCCFEIVPHGIAVRLSVVF